MKLQSGTSYPNDFDPSIYTSIGNMKCGIETTSNRKWAKIHYFEQESYIKNDLSLTWFVNDCHIKNKQLEPASHSLQNKK